MFTGIIESIGEIVKINKNNHNIHFTLYSNLTKKLKINQSLAHNGVCLNVINIDKECYQVIAIEETLKKSNLKSLQINSLVNLERSLKINDRLDGHIIQGHVDETGIIQSINYLNNNFLIKILKTMNQFITVKKGSIALNGISLTIVDNDNNTFTTAITKYTWENTNLYKLNINDEVNLEFDIIGKYIETLYKNKKFYNNYKK